MRGTPARDRLVRQLERQHRRGDDRSEIRQMHADRRPPFRLDRNAQQRRAGIDPCVERPRRSSPCLLCRQPGAPAAELRDVRRARDARASARNPRQGPSSSSTVPKPSGGGTCASNAPMAAVGSAQTSPAIAAPSGGAQHAGAVAQRVQPIGRCGARRAQETPAQRGDLCVQRQAGHVRADAEQRGLVRRQRIGGGGGGSGSRWHRRWRRTRDAAGRRSRRAGPPTTPARAT